jgi:hypothetical protein
MAYGMAYRKRNSPVARAKIGFLGVTLSASIDAFLWCSACRRDADGPKHYSQSSLFGESRANRKLQ